MKNEPDLFAPIGFGRPEWQPIAHATTPPVPPDRLSTIDRMVQSVIIPSADAYLTTASLAYNELLQTAQSRGGCPPACREQIRRMQRLHERLSAAVRDMRAQLHGATNRPGSTVATTALLAALDHAEVDASRWIAAPEAWLRPMLKERIVLAQGVRRAVAALADALRRNATVAGSAATEPVQRMAEDADNPSPDGEFGSNRTGTTALWNVPYADCAA